MPIVVKHEPNASAVLGLSQMAGEGAFNRWKTEFEARQKQYAFQNLMSGLSAGQSLAAPFINIAGQQAQRAFQSGEAAKARTLLLKRCPELILANPRKGSNPKYDGRQKWACYGDFQFGAVRKRRS